MAVSNIVGGTTQEPIEDVSRKNSSVVKDNLFEQPSTRESIISRFIYSKLGNLTDNRVLVEPEVYQNEYDLFLAQMENLAWLRYNDEDTGEVSDEIIDMDIYLANLGLDDDYAFKDDYYDMDPWINIEDQALYRNVAYLDENNESFNVITEIDSVVYNVIHNTQELTTGAINAG